MFLILALILFLASATWSAVLRAWPMVLLALGLLLWAVDTAGPIRIG